MRSACKRGLRVGAAVAILTCAASAQTWKGATTDGLWSDPANWSTGVTPVGGSSTRLHFGYTFPVDPYTAVNDLPGPFVLNRLTFGPSVNRRYITGNALHFVASPDGALPEVNHLEVGEVNITAPVVLGADTTFRSTPERGRFHVTGGISGPGKLTVVGIFSYYNPFATTSGPPDATFGGGADVTGTLIVRGRKSRPPAFGTGTITFHGNSTYNVGGEVADEPLTLATPIVVDGSLAMTAGAKIVTLDADLRVGGAFRYKGLPSLVHPAGRALRLDNASAGTNTLQFEAASPIQIDSDVADTSPAAPANPLLIRANIDTTFSGRNAFRGDVTVEGFRSATIYDLPPARVTFTPNSAFAGNLSAAGDARVRVESAASIAPGRTVTIAPGASFEFGPAQVVDTSLIRAKINPASAGVLALTSTPGDGLDLTGFDGLILGRGAESAVIAKPFTPANRTYRLADLYVRAGVLTGDNALVVGTGVRSDSAVVLEGTNTFSGGTTIVSGGLWAGTGAMGTGPVRVTGTGRFSVGTSAPNGLTGSNSLEISEFASAHLFAANDYTGGTTLNTANPLNTAVWVWADHALGTGPVTLHAGKMALNNVTVGNTFHVNGGVLHIGSGTITNTVRLAAGARLAGGGVVDSLIGGGSVDNDGYYVPTTLTVRHELSPEGAPGVPVTLRIGKVGSFLEDRVGLALTPTSILKIDLLGANTNDLVQVATSATLDGALALTVAPGFDPAAGSSFDVMTFASRSGEFDAVTANFPNAAEYELQYLTDRLRVVVLTPEPVALPTLAAVALITLRRPRRRSAPPSRARAAAQSRGRSCGFQTTSHKCPSGSWK